MIYDNVQNINVLVLLNFMFSVYRFLKLFNNNSSYFNKKLDKYFLLQKSRKRFVWESHYDCIKHAQVFLVLVSFFNLSFLSFFCYEVTYFVKLCKWCREQIFFILKNNFQMINMATCYNVPMPIFQNLISRFEISQYRMFLFFWSNEYY